MTLFWLAAVIVFGVVEVATVGLASIWFAVGAVAALLLSLAVESLWVQIAAFAVVSILSMAIIRPLAQKFLNPKLEATNSDRIIGREGIVLEDIDNLQAKGQVTVAGVQWTARSEEGTPISAGTQVTVLRIEGVKAFVRPAKSAGEKEE